jgi:glutaredoxin 2
MVTEYISFSDSSMSYNDEDLEKLILESNNLPQDQITAESDVNELLRKIVTSNFKIINSKVYDINLNPLSGSELINYFDEVSKSSLENFKKLQIIKSYDSFDQFENLSSNITSSYFSITKDDINQFDNTNKPNFNLNINTMPSIFLDPDASKSKNYLYLPPVDENNNQLFDYGFKKGTNEIINDVSLRERLKNKKRSIFKLIGSGKNHIQIFQSQNDMLKKLDIIKYGEFIDEESNKNEAYFAGKLIVDETGNSTFYRMFTILIK